MRMVKEYIGFIRDFFAIAELKKLYTVITFIAILGYKVFLLLMPLVASFIIEALTAKDADATFAYLALLAVVYILYSATLFLDYKMYARNMNYSYRNLQTKLLTKLLTVDSNFSRTISRGRLMNSINQDVISIGDMNDCVSEFIATLIQLVAIFIIVAFFNVFVAIIMIVSSLLFILVKNMVDRKNNPHYQKSVIQDDKYSSLLTQVISGLQEIKTFNLFPKFAGRLKTIQRGYTKHYTLKRKYIVMRDNDTRLIDYTVRALLYFILILLMANGVIGINILVMIIMYQESIFSDYVVWLIGSTATIRERNVSVQRVSAILNYDSSVVPYGNLDTSDLFGSIEFKNVSLNIKGHQILKNINLKINHSSVVAIVGEAGAGKTMLFDLLLRQQQPTKGTIKIDNTDIQDFTAKAYAENISIVNQKPFVFNMSIRKNLDFADTDTKHQIAACKRAGIHDFIMTLPDGYDTILREDAKNISGGQKQMISIARTILMNSEILLLDDVTTSLDPDTAKLVPKLIDDLKEDRTVVMITKKPDLMKCADRIIVLANGKIIGDGPHDKLIKTNEAYQMFYSRKSPSKIGVFDHV